MHVIIARNVHAALPQGLDYLRNHGRQETSRNGAVLVAPGPVTTVYTHPLERVLFWPQRDANVAFLLYEALWMLAGRNDLKPLLRYVKTFGDFSDDGETLHGAYGFRWRYHFGLTSFDSIDQLSVIAERLKEDPTDRRCVLAMWDADIDLAYKGKDAPCNDTATFQIRDGKLNLVVFCRSNDIVWGAYFANAFHFGMLLEYMAHWIGCEVGTYHQVSVNYHAYASVWKSVASVEPSNFSPYRTGLKPIEMKADGPNHEHLDYLIANLLEAADNDFTNGNGPDPDGEPWARSIYLVLKAHHQWRTLPARDRYREVIKTLGSEEQFQNIDWVVAMLKWVVKRQAKANQVSA